MNQEEALIEHLKTFATAERVETFLRVLESRTRYLTFVLEDIYQPQNASAVLRSADGFGIQDVHIIENNHEYVINKMVEKGASSWLNLHKYDGDANNTLEAIKKLKADGYRIVATTPHTDDVDLEDFDITKGKTAIVLGTEVTGISDIVREEADEFLKIPMYGFTESFNISVSAAIIMQHLRLKLEQSEVDWKLSEDEANQLLISWFRKSIKASDDIIERFNHQK
jgi:tRNA (guanosine-2'-O-)-methyltransferase